MRSVWCLCVRASAPATKKLIERLVKNMRTLHKSFQLLGESHYTVTGSRAQSPQLPHTLQSSILERRFVLCVFVIEWRMQQGDSACVTRTHTHTHVASIDKICAASCVCVVGSVREQLRFQGGTYLCSRTRDPRHASDDNRRRRRRRAIDSQLGVRQSVFVWRIRDLYLHTVTRAV